jgi:hypothetical protein
VLVVWLLLHLLLKQLPSLLQEKLRPTIKEPEVFLNSFASSSFGTLPSYLKDFKEALQAWFQLISKAQQPLREQVILSKWQQAF